MAIKNNQLLAEIVNSQGFINIDQNDVDRFKTDIEDIDAVKVSGRNEEVGVMLDNTISSIKKRNGDKLIKKVLFVIRLSHENNFMEYVGEVQDVMDRLDEDVECQWGVSTSEKLQYDQLELIVVIGF